jgi:hypothetical protein
LLLARGSKGFDPVRTQAGRGAGAARNAARGRPDGQALEEGGLPRRLAAPGRKQQHVHTAARSAQHASRRGAHRRTLPCGEG